MIMELLFIYYLWYFVEGNRFLINHDFNYMYMLLHGLQFTITGEEVPRCTYSHYKRMGQGGSMSSFLSCNHLKLKLHD